MSDLSQTPPSKTPERFDDGVYLHALEALHDEAPKRKRWKMWALIAALVLALVAVPLAYRWATESSNQAPSLSLSIAPAGADVLIAWTGGASHSRSSKLKVRDDGHEEEFDLRPSYEIAGTLVYHPKTSHVHVMWSVDAGGRFYGKEADYQVRAVAPHPVEAAGAAPVPVAKPAVSTSSNRELERLQVHNRRMEALVKALKAREQSAKPQ